VRPARSEHATLTGPGGRDTSLRAEMEPSTNLRLAPSAKLDSQSGPELFKAALQEKPLPTSLGLVVEYLTFGSAVSLAVSLYLTRKPMEFVDRKLGLRLRDRFVDLIARVSPG
jgi:hypothetical protein